jgi:quaternary ammonium compound-resistance protein SugE
MSWMYLFIASLMEICWMYSLKSLDFGRIRTAPWAEALSDASPWQALLPLLGYVGFGVANVYFFSLATKTIPMAVAFAVWTGVALLGAVLVDTFFFKEPSTWKQLLFMTLIVVGVIGLRSTEAKG